MLGCSACILADLACSLHCIHACSTSFYLECLELGMGVAPAVLTCLGWGWEVVGCLHISRCLGVLAGGALL